MIKHKIYTFIVFAILIVGSLVGCEREEEFLMSIENVEIYITPIYQPDIFSVSVLVTGAFVDGCLTLHETQYKIEPHLADRHPIYLDGDTNFIEIPLTKSVGNRLTGYSVCDLASPYYIDVIFLGFCKPGEYTLDVNGYIETFKVG